MLGAALATWGLAAACADEAPEPEASRAPDVVLVLIDTFRADHSSLYGYARETTPNLDALAAQGRWYRRAHAHSGWTLPAVATLFTGLEPHEHGVGRDALEPQRFGRLAEDVPTLAEVLRGRGYRTAAVVNNTFLAPAFGLARGFECYDYLGADNHNTRSAARTVELGLAWLDEADGPDAPAFLLLHFMEPHLDYDPPADVRGTFSGPAPEGFEAAAVTERWLDSFEPDPTEASEAEFAYIVGLYDEEILAADRALGALVDGLRARGRLERTLLVVTADHGEELFDHGGFEHGHTLFGELTRVPLVVVGPGVEPGPDASMFQHADLHQLMLDLAEGQSRPGSAPSEREYVFAENVLYGAPRASIATPTERLEVELIGKRYELWQLDDCGLDVRPVDDAEHPSYAHLLEQLRLHRGDLDPLPLRSGPVLPDTEAYEQLRALGYVDGR